MTLIWELLLTPIVLGMALAERQAEVVLHAGHYVGILVIAVALLLPVLVAFRWLGVLSVGPHPQLSLSLLTYAASQLLVWFLAWAVCAAMLASDGGDRAEGVGRFLLNLLRGLALFYGGWMAISLALLSLLLWPPFVSDSKPRMSRTDHLILCLKAVTIPDAIFVFALAVLHIELRRDVGLPWWWQWAVPVIFVLVRLWSTASLSRAAAVGSASRTHAVLRASWVGGSHLLAYVPSASVVAWRLLNSFFLG